MSHVSVEFLRVIGVNDDTDFKVTLIKHTAQLLGDSLRNHYWQSRVDSQASNMRNGF